MNDKIQLKQDGRFFFGWWIVFLGFCLMLCTKILRIYFSGAPTEIKLLTLPLAGSLIYSLLETSLFVVADFRAFLFYIIAGAVLAYNE